MHSQTHTFAVKVWKWLCMTTEQPKALQGINNRPNLRQQTQSVGCWGKWGVMFVNMCECVCVDVGGTGGYEHVISMCVWIFAWLSCFICLCACVFALAGVIAFLVCVCMSVNNEPPYLCYSTGLLWPPRTCWLLHSNPPKTFRPKKNK